MWPGEFIAERFPSDTEFCLFDRVHRIPMPDEQDWHRLPGIREFIAVSFQIL
jgi:hypothetical protein